ncbi:uncharacterized protein LOC114933735 isoform X1 [Nylanderia fulva]|uniref:uncharacterized protein LOC114933735 isoform X1 n=3 Tax=Nylanderia fulva TaxID=613905 RepID=UPI0010FB00C7|nr:uncharacterized protein LOC114933735 isoform X1 [Nylanderia fulva]
MTILSKSSDTTANSSCNTSILGNLELSDVNLSDVNVSDMNGIDINNFENCGTNLNNNNGEEMIHEVLAENKSTFTSITENTELDSTIVPFCDLNGVKNSSINNDINNNDNKLYCSNSQIENVSQNTDFEKNKISNVSDKDSDYEPSIQSSNDTDIEHTDIEINDDLEIANNESSILANSSENANEKNMLEKEIETCKDDELFVELSQGPKGDKKYNFCFYCNTMQSKIARHLELKHKNEEEVKMFLLLPKKSRERRDAISQIRKRGNFKYNTQADLNNGSMIVVRRPTKEEKQCGSYFLPCSKCRGHYAIHNLRHHYRICAKKKDTTRNVLKLARSAAQSVHNRASHKLRKDILPVMRNDNIYKLIKYDLLIILYGNYLCQIHRLQHLGDHIRQQLRLLGRYLEVLKSIEPAIQELQMLFDPKYYDIAIKAVNIIAKYNEDTESYDIPYNATAMGTCLKKLCKILINEFIKQHEYEKQKSAKNFLKILEVEYGSTVNKTVTEIQTRNSRKKKVNLPKTSDIKKLTNYLEEIRVSSMREIKNKFTFCAWKSLAEAILIMIQIFNRRRAGEIERAYIVDYKNFIKITKEDELYKRLPQKEKISALKYIRFTIRGKLNRNVPVLLNAKMKEALDIILRYRKLAGVSSKNPYIFGLPGADKKRFRYLRASKLMREFANLCGAENKESLRGTILRKDMATKCSHLPDSEISLIADFMGHHKDIHKNIYRQPVVESDILNMAKILEKTQDISTHNTDIDTTNNTNTNTTNSNSTTDANTSENSINEIQSLVEDEASENNLPKKILLKQKNVKKRAIENINNSDEECAPKKKRFTPPYGKTRRIRWTSEEKQTALLLFETNINNSTLPSLKEIISKTRKNILKNRQPAAIKTWIHNQFRNKI